MAELLCICSDLPIFCPDCQSAHQSKPGFHFFLPLQASECITPHNQHQYQLWLFSLKHSQDLLRDNLKWFDQCRADIQAWCQTVKQQLNDLETTLLQTLEGMKQALTTLIEDAIRETSNNAYRGDYQPRTYLSDVIYQQSSDLIPVF